MAPADCAHSYLSNCVSNPLLPGSLLVVTKSHDFSRIVQACPCFRAQKLPVFWTGLSPGVHLTHLLKWLGLSQTHTHQGGLPWSPYTKLPSCPHPFPSTSSAVFLLDSTYWHLTFLHLLSSLFGSADTTKIQTFESWGLLFILLSLVNGKVSGT